MEKKKVSAFQYTRAIHLRAEFWAIPETDGLPAGTWEKICTTEACTREQAKQIVEGRQADYRRSDVQMTLYKNYVDEFKSYTEPLYSLESLFKSKGCDTTKNWAILKKH